MATLQQPRSRAQRRPCAVPPVAPAAVFDAAVGTVSCAAGGTACRLPAALRTRLLAVYGLVAAEALLFLLQPLVIGLAINGLLDSSIGGLLLFAVQYLLLTLTAAARRMLGPRIFAAVDADLPSRGVSPEAPCRDGEKDAADRRYHLEQTIPDRLRRTVLVGGALLLLAWYDLTLLPLCLLLIVPFGLLQAAYGPRIARMVRQRDEWESKLTQDRDPAAEHDLRQQREAVHALSARLADAVAVRKVLVDLFALGMLASGIVHFLGCGVTSPPAGDIFAVVCYLLLFARALCVAPLPTSRQEAVDLSTF